MNEIVDQARARFAAAASACDTELSEAGTRLADAQAAARRNSEELRQANAQAVTAFKRQTTHASDRMETFSFGLDPEEMHQPPGRRRPESRGDADDEDGPRIFNEDSW